MSSIAKLFSKDASARIALLLLTIIVIIHVAISYAFIHNNRTILRNANRDAIIQKIINTVHLVEATPVLNRSHAVKAFEDPDVHLTLSRHPEFDLQFNQLSLWSVIQALRGNYESFAISIQMEPGQWLNIKANVYSHFLLTQILLISFEIIVFGAILFSAWSINRFTQPLKNFKKAADQLGIDLHTKPLTVYGPSIVRETAEAINTMQTRIQDLISDRTLMLAAISHDLRTPITRMKLRAQFVKDHDLYQKFIHDLDEMELMISQTLSFAREDNETEESKKIDLSSLLASICNDSQDMGHQIRFYCKQQCIPYVGRPIALKRAFSNLISNATKYASKVVVSAKVRFKSITISIQDNGPGILESDLEKAFQPFYRGDPSRSRDTGGVGLGLAVTKDIITKHGGTIKLHNHQQGGLLVTIKLPALK